MFLRFFAFFCFYEIPWLDGVFSSTSVLNVEMFHDEEQAKILATKLGFVHERKVKNQSVKHIGSIREC